jgi:two-component system sensor histidine kinase MprB
MRFRGTLAARVALLATVAVGLAVAFVATAAYLTVQHQLETALDDSLLNRASAAAQADVLVQLTENDYPSWVLGAADVQIAVVYATGHVVGSDQSEVPAITWSSQEVGVAQGKADYSLRTVPPCRATRRERR